MCQGLQCFLEALKYLTSKQHPFETPGALFFFLRLLVARPGPREELKELLGERLPSWMIEEHGVFLGGLEFWVVFFLFLFIFVGSKSVLSVVFVHFLLWDSVLCRLFWRSSTYLCSMWCLETVVWHKRLFEGQCQVFSKCFGLLKRIRFFAKFLAWKKLCLEKKTRVFPCIAVSNRLDVSRLMCFNCVFLVAWPWFGVSARSIADIISI